MATSEALAVEEYKSSLNDLEMNSKPIINMLTMLAEENVNYASGIVAAIEEHINTVRPQLQLPAMYLLDSILKNVQNEGGTGSAVYRPLFARNIVSIFLTVFTKGEESTRERLFKLRQTWRGHFPNSKLYAIDLKVNAIDPKWPVTLPEKGPAAEPSTSQTNSTKIHVNPKFLNKGPEPSVESFESRRENLVSRREEEIMRLRAEKERKELELYSMEKGDDKRKPYAMGGARDPRLKRGDPTLNGLGEDRRGSKNAQSRKHAGTHKSHYTPSMKQGSDASSGNNSPASVSIERTDPRGHRKENEGNTRKKPEPTVVAEEPKQIVPQAADSDMRPKEDSDMRKAMIKLPLKKRPRGETPTRDSRDSASSSSDIADFPSEKPADLPSKPKKKRDTPEPEIQREPQPHPGPKERDVGHSHFARGRGGPRGAPRGGPRGAGPRGRGGPFNNRNDQGPPFRRGGGGNHGGPVRPFGRNPNSIPLDKPPSPDHQNVHPTSMPGSHAFETSHQPAPPMNYGGPPEPMMSGPPFSRGGLLPCPPRGPPIPPMPPTSNPTFPDNQINLPHPNGPAGPGGPFHFDPPPPPAARMNAPPISQQGMGGGFGMNNMMQEPPQPPQQPLDPIPANNRIFVDGRAYEVQYVDDIPVIERNGVPHKIYFTGPPREVVIDGVAHSLAFGDRKTVNIDGQPHTIRFGAPSRELYMGTHPFRGAFGGPPIYATINGNRHQIRLNGPPPEVKIEPEPCHELMRFMPRHANNRQAIDYRAPTRQQPQPIQPLPPLNNNNGGVTDVNTIVQNLLNSGLLPSIQELKAAGAQEKVGQKSPNSRPVTPPRPCTQYSEEEQVERRQSRPPPDLKNFSMRSLKIRYQPVIDGLYSSAQRCNNCGLRFENLDSIKYRKHLDWHFRESTRIESSQSRQRPWYSSTEDWIEGELSEDPANKGKPSGNEEQQEDVAEDGENGPQENVIPAVDGETSCSVCREVFDQFWDEDGEIWKFRNAILVDGKVYHPLCFQDASVLGGPSEPETPFLMTGEASFSGMFGLPGLEPQMKQEPEDVEGSKEVGSRPSGDRHLASIVDRPYSSAVSSDSDVALITTNPRSVIPSSTCTGVGGVKAEEPWEAEDASGTLLPGLGGPTQSSAFGTGGLQAGHPFATPNSFLDSGRRSPGTPLRDEEGGA